MKLEEEERYEILSSLFPDTREKIYLEMVGEELAKKYPFNNTTLKGINETIKKIQSESELIVGRKTLISEQINTLRSFPAPTTDITEDILELKRQDITNHEVGKPALSSEVKQTTPEISLLKGELAANKVKLRQLTEKEPSREKLDELKTKYTMAVQECEALEMTGACPTCHRAYEGSEMETKKATAKAKADGLLAEAKTIRVEYDAEKMGWEQEKKNLEETIQKQEEKLETLQANLLAAQSGDVEYFNKQLEAWDARRKELESEYANISGHYREYLTRKADFDSNADKIAKLQKELEELNNKLGNDELLGLEKVKEALGPKGVEFKEAQSKLDDIIKFFPEGTEIELLRKNKTNDEFKKVFSVTVDGVNYAWLSKGMRKVFDIYVAELIGNKLGIDCMCIDDNESLTTGIALTNREKQIITLTARDTDFTCDIIPYSK
jgi:DNA repair exonuclease SbcCD ATPase subunit